MEKIPYTNASDVAVYVGGKLLQPGETREFQPGDLPGEHRPAAAGAEVAPKGRREELSALLLATLSVIIPGLGALSDEDLELLLELEGEGAKRVSLGRAIEAERVTRANARLDADRLAEAQNLAAQQLEQRIAAAEAALLAAQVARDADPEKGQSLQEAVSAAQAELLAAQNAKIDFQAD